MDLSPKGVARLAGRLGAAGQNALEVARFGGLDTEEESSPYEVVTEQRVYRLRRYFPDSERKPDAPAIVLVPPMMLAAEVFDVSPATSAVGILEANGADPWVVDFGAPEREEGGLERTLTDHVVALSDAVDRVRELVGRDVHIGGYSQGGMFCYQAAAYRRADGVASVITFGSPVDTHGMIPFGLPEELVTKGIGFLADRVVARYALPAWASRTGFRLMDPVKSVRQRADFVRQLHNREALLPREGQRRFLEAEGWVAWPGPALAELMKQFVATNRMVSGGFVIDDRMVTLADLTCPLLCFVGEVDEIAPARVVRAVSKAAPRADVYQVPLRAGHFGLVVGSLATSVSWPTVAAWGRWRDGMGERPENVEDMPTDDDADAEQRPSPSLVSRYAHALGLAAEVGVGMARGARAAATRSGRVFREMATEAIDQLPRLGRLENVHPKTRISLGLLLDEQARKQPDATFFLFEGRGYTYGAAKGRIDAIVRGLISVGVRQGEHVGVLMHTRPSALAVISALSRLGAVVVLLRPDGSPAREAELGQVTRIIADPEDGEVAAESGLPVLVLGGGGEPRELGFGLLDMERIDPDAVEVPAWYSPNPGLARDLAFILFTGHGTSIRMNRITNGRWALSAFGTASAAALSASDTVYSVTPVHHPSGVLTSLGGAVAGGARVALASSFEPSTFWDEVRRYGVTVVSYTWALVQPLLAAPPDPAEKHHPVRLFIGSGMPVSLWRRILSRFRPAAVLEFYASTEGEAVLVNLTGHKVGSKGKPLPGSVDVRIAQYDTESGRLVEGPDGFAVPCRRGEVGMLLSRARTERGGLLGTPLRGVFNKGDEWQITGDLFLRDEDGDFWWVDHIQALVRTASGPVPSIPIEDALGWVEAVDLAIAFGVPAADGNEIVVAAVSLRDGYELDGAALAGALRDFADRERPAVVRIVDEIPLTTWYRPLKAPVREQGVPPMAEGGTAWVWDAKSGGYRPLTEAARKRLRLSTA
ncbi:MAG: AMP-binding protein [Acidimicrobiales bacterium]